MICRRHRPLSNRKFNLICYGGWSNDTDRTPGHTSQLWWFRKADKIFQKHQCYVVPRNWTKCRCIEQVVPSEKYKIMLRLSIILDICENPVVCLFWQFCSWHWKLLKKEKISSLYSFSEACISSPNEDGMQKARLFFCGEHPWYILS